MNQKAITEEGLPLPIAQVALKLLAIAELQPPKIMRTSTQVDALHDYRVALRKLRSLISQLKKLFPDDSAKLLNQHLGLLARKTNTLRDMDVYHEQWQAYLAPLTKKQQKLLNQLSQKELKRHQRERAQVVAWLTSKRCQRSFQSIRRWFAQAEKNASPESKPEQLQQWLHKQMKKRYRVITAAAQALHDQVSDDELHALRIQGKKLRYLIELFPDISEKSEWQPLLKPMKKLQRHLGNVNDCAVQLQGVRRKQSRLMQKKVPHQAATLNALLEVKKQIKRRQKQEREEATKLLAQLKESFGPASN
ncbi:CHAD domain-containing protein [Corallincola platygyrae]|uniref:CHAD domain-containing protein n=1 Tax=Corallincola platygyrae TaxID=1193278 RepID=A0ABW4XQ72_9GAMM